MIYLLWFYVETHLQLLFSVHMTCIIIKVLMQYLIHLSQPNIKFSKKEEKIYRKKPLWDFKVEMVQENNVFFNSFSGGASVGCLWLDIIGIFSYSLCPFKGEKERFNTIFCSLYIWNITGVNMSRSFAQRFLTDTCWTRRCL